MRQLLLTLFATLLTFATAQAIDSAAAFSDPALQARYENLTHQLRCLQCANETIADSPVDLAADLRRKVQELMAEGRSDAEILKYMTDRYGDFILYRPPFVARTWLLWAAPILLVTGGLIVAVLVILRRARAASLESPDLTDDGAA